MFSILGCLIVCPTLGLAQKDAGHGSFFTCLFECICSKCPCETSSCLSAASTQQAYKPKLRPAFLVWSLIQLGKLNKKCKYQLFIQWPNHQSQSTQLLTFLLFLPHTTPKNNSGHVECTCLDYVAFPQCLWLSSSERHSSLLQKCWFFPLERDVITGWINWLMSQLVTDKLTCSG